MSNLRYWIEEIGVDGLRIDSTVCVRKTGGTDNECWQTNDLDNDELDKYDYEPASVAERFSSNEQEQKEARLSIIQF